MRLNNSIKQAFVKSVLDDSALVDYNTQITDRVKQYFYQIAPEEVKKIYDNPKTRKYIGQNSVSLNYGGNEYLSPTGSLESLSKTGESEDTPYRGKTFGERVGRGMVNSKIPGIQQLGAKLIPWGVGYEGPNKFNEPTNVNTSNAPLNNNTTVAPVDYSQQINSLLNPASLDFSTFSKQYELLKIFNID